jgi:hypothetical protein
VNLNSPFVRDERETLEFLELPNFPSVSVEEPPPASLLATSGLESDAEWYSSDAGDCSSASDAVQALESGPVLGDPFQIPCFVLVTVDADGTMVVIENQDKNTVLSDSGPQQEEDKAESRQLETAGGGDTQIQPKPIKRPRVSGTNRGESGDENDFSFLSIVT